MPKFILLTIEPETYNNIGTGRIAIPISEIEIIYEAEECCCVRMRTEFDDTQVIVPTETFDQIIERINEANNPK